MATATTSFIRTNGAALTRAVDIASVGLSIRPQAMTVYVRLLEMAPPATAVFSRRILHIGKSDNSNPRFILLHNVASGFYGVLLQVHVGTQIVALVSSSSVTVGDSVEVRATMTNAGVLQAALTINEGTEVVGTASSASPLPQVWSGPTLWIGSINGSTPGNQAIRDICIARGVQTLASMRRMAGVKP